MSYHPQPEQQNQSAHPSQKKRKQRRRKEKRSLITNHHHDFEFAGSTAFVALGGYSYFSGMKSLRERRRVIEMSASRYKYGSRQLGIMGLSATLVGLGLYRTFN